MDVELFKCFLNESFESLDNIENDLMKFEKNPKDLNIVDTIFRPVHSIKGSSSFFNLHNLNKLTHSIENILDLFRKKKLAASAEIISVLLEGIELIKTILKRSADSKGEIEEEDNFDNLIFRIESSKDILEKPDVLFNKVFSELNNLKVMLESKNFEGSLGTHSKVSDLFSTLQKNSGVVVNLIIGPPSEFIKIKEMLEEKLTGYAENEKVNEILTGMKTTLELFKDGPERKDYEHLIEEYELMSSTCGLDESLRAMTSNRFNKFISEVNFALLKDKSLSKSDELKTSENKVVEQELEKVVIERTVRISEALIDQFFADIGELLIINENYMFIRDSLKSGNRNMALSDFMRVNTLFEDTLKNMYKNIMQIRKGEIGIVFKKLPKIIRDVAQKLGKKIDLQITGKEITVDKSILEHLEAPLMHMVRNAADHGIESRDMRLAAGKQEQGFIDITAKESDDTLIIEICDDGKGIDMKALAKKAKELGIHEEITNDNLAKILFTPGISTAEKITDISGRGVGLDVVNDNLKKISGHLDIQTEAGKGTTFTISILTKVATQIIVGYMVRIQKHIIVIPIQYVKNATLEDEQRDNVILHDDSIVSVVSASELYDLGPTDEPEKVKLFLSFDNRDIALSVHELIVIKKMVVKEIDYCGYHSPCFNGGSLQADGKIALVANIEYLFKYNSDKIS